jgi:RNA polymerase sigma factor (sigma-70 family)
MAPNPDLGGMALNYAEISKRYRPLDKAQQLELLKRKDEPRIRQKLILHNLGLVLKNANYFINHRHLTHLSYEDLVSEGLLGLHRAIELYEVERGFTLATYAHYWIRQSIRRGIQQREATIRVPVYVMDEISKGSRPHPIGHVYSLDQPVLGDDGRMIGDLIEDPSDSVDWDTEVDPWEAVQPLLDPLPEDWKTAVCLRELDDLPFADVGARMGISKDSARKIHRQAMRRLTRLYTTA